MNIEKSTTATAAYELSPYTPQMPTPLSNPPSPPPISVTPRAAEMGRKRLEEAEEESIGLRLGVKGGGCSGYYYVYELAKKIRKRDSVYEFDGLQVVVDNRSLELLDGATLDWEQKLMGYGFKWVNPNATGDCGCGASFTTG